MQLERVGPYRGRIPRGTSRGMRVPGLVVAGDRLIESIKHDASLAQIADGATLRFPRRTRTRCGRRGGPARQIDSRRAPAPPGGDQGMTERPEGASDRMVN